MAFSKCSQISKLDQQVTFKTPTEAKNAVHEIIQTWANISTDPTVWAQIEPVNGREYFESQQIRAESNVKITIRARSDLTTKMRVVHGSVTYEIDYIPPYIRQQYMTLMCHVVT